MTAQPTTIASSPARPGVLVRTLQVACALLTLDILVDGAAMLRPPFSRTVEAGELALTVAILAAAAAATLAARRQSRLLSQLCSVAVWLAVADSLFDALALATTPWAMPLLAGELVLTVLATVVLIAARLMAWRRPLKEVP